MTGTRVAIMFALPLGLSTGAKAVIQNRPRPANRSSNSAAPGETLTEQQQWDLVAYIRALVVFHRKSLPPGPPDEPARQSSIPGP